MSMAKAVRLCPKALVIHPRHSRYEEISKQVFEVLHQFTPLVEGLSIDEAFLDITGTRRLHEIRGGGTNLSGPENPFRNSDFGIRIAVTEAGNTTPTAIRGERQSAHTGLEDSKIRPYGSRRLENPKSEISFDWARDVAAQIKRRIREGVGLTASVGVSFNKFLAKLASDLKKPDGLVVIEPSQVHEILDPLPVTKIWGVGPAAAKQLDRLNIRTIGQLRRADRELMARVLGLATAEHYLGLAAGEDDRPVVAEGQAKSVGQEETFAVDIDRPDKLRSVLLGQVQEVARRLRKQELLARTVTLKLRHGDFTTITRSRTLDEPTDSTDALWQASAALLKEWAATAFRPLRLLGMHASNLTGHRNRQLGLFENTANQKQSRLDKTVDSIARTIRGEVHFTGEGREERIARSEERGAKGEGRRARSLPSAPLTGIVHHLAQLQRRCGRTYRPDRHASLW